MKQADDKAKLKHMLDAALDEDLSIAGLLEGIPSNESQESFQKWLEERKST